MIIVKHARKEKVYVYETETDYKKSFYGSESKHIASFYCNWAHGGILDVTAKCRQSGFINESDKIRGQLSEYFREYSSRQYLPIEFYVDLSKFYSKDFMNIIEIKSLLRIS